jgi:predicted transcriptional regulator
MVWRVVEDPGVAPSDRAAAAVALGARLDDADRSRLRRIAEACAAPRLRVALETIADTAEGDRDERDEAKVARARAGL